MTAVTRAGGNARGESGGTRRRRALLYGDIDLNLIDGSAIWMQSMVQALTRAGCSVTLVLKTPLRTGRLLAPLLADPGVIVRRPFEEGLLDGVTDAGMNPVQASRLLTVLDAPRRHDLVVLRGRRAAEQVAADGGFDGRLWTYLTDIPQSVFELDGDAVAELTRIAQSSRYLLCQTEELRCFLESSVPAACGKCELLRPVVPPLEVPDEPDEPERAAGPLRLVYTGKFAPRWNTYEMTQLPRLLAAAGVRAEIHLVGDKIHDDPAGSREDVVEVVAHLASDAEARKLAIDRARAAAAGFTLDCAVERLRALLRQAFPAGPPTSAGTARTMATAPGAGQPVPPGAAPLKVAVAGHDLRFFTRILEYLRHVPWLDVRLDHWPALAEHDEAASAALAGWADVVICEWCGPNAIWYSRHKRRGSRLLVRLHRFELYSRYVHDVDIAAIDQVVCVSRHYARLASELAGWPAAKIVTVPNCVDLGQLDRPKLEGARHHLGIVGVVPSRKRLDLALDVLAELRRDDERYMLYVKSTMPWDHWWIWKRATERAHYVAAARRIQRDPLLRGRVVLDPAGPDVPARLRRVGFVLSTSDDESFHVAPAEGMASRAVPVVRNWPGAQTIYQPRWIHATPAAMAASVGAMTDTQWLSAGELARRHAEPFGINQVCAAWRGLLTDDLPPAAPGPVFELLGTV